MWFSWLVCQREPSRSITKSTSQAAPGEGDQCLVVSYSFRSFAVVVGAGEWVCQGYESGGEEGALSALVALFGGVVATD